VLATALLVGLELGHEHPVRAERDPAGAHLRLRVHEFDREPLEALAARREDAAADVGIRDVADRLHLDLDAPRPLRERRRLIGRERLGASEDRRAAGDDGHRVDPELQPAADLRPHRVPHPWAQRGAADHQDALEALRGEPLVLQRLAAQATYAARQETNLPLPPTRWSLVGRAAASDEQTRGAALSELLVVYMPCLRAFLVQSRRVPADLADDLLREAMNLLANAKRCFHKHLRTAVGRYVGDESGIDAEIADLHRIVSR
jgi:hypothetical protein